MYLFLSLYDLITELEYRCGEAEYHCFNGDEPDGRRLTYNSYFLHIDNLYYPGEKVYDKCLSDPK